MAAFCLCRIRVHFDAAVLCNPSPSFASAGKVFSLYQDRLLISFISPQSLTLFPGGQDTFSIPRAADPSAAWYNWKESHSEQFWFYGSSLTLDISSQLLFKKYLNGYKKGKPPGRKPRRLQKEKQDYSIPMVLAYSLYSSYHWLYRSCSIISSMISLTRSVSSSSPLGIPILVPWVSSSTVK